MMDWLRRMIGPNRHQTGPVGQPVLNARPVASPELAAARLRHKQLLTRADIAIKEAMDHADEMFEAESAYRGPDRRGRAR